MSANQQSQMDAWEKWEWLWKTIFYATILASFGIVLLDSNRAVPLWVTGLLTTGMLLWHWFGMRLAHRGLTSWDERPLPRFAVILGDIVLWFILVNISPAFYITLFGLFIMVFRHLPIRYAVIAAVLLMTATIFEQVDGTDGSFSLTDPVIWLFLFMVLVSIALGFWISNIIVQSTQRRQLIEQLEATRAELAAAERREGILEERQRLAGRSTIRWPRDLPASSCTWKLLSRLSPTHRRRKNISTRRVRLLVPVWNRRAESYRTSGLIPWKNNPYPRR